MAQIGDLITRLFSAGGTRGLSGDVELVLPDDPELGFFNECLRRHRAGGDLVGDPTLLWEAPTEGVRKNGLLSHLATEGTDGIAGFTDVLVILSPADWRRVDLEGVDRWSAGASEHLAARVRDWIADSGVQVPFAGRPVGVRFIEDGGAQMGGQSLGLSAGEFVTGLIPNHHQPLAGESGAVITVYLNIPGAWEGYRDVVSLYDDQVMLTLGSHWLDNFAHPQLQRPALYRLQRQAAGGFVHIISPEFQDQYRITSQAVPGGPSVLTVTDFMGDPIAHLVLAVVERKAEPAPQPSPPPRAEPQPPVAPPPPAAELPPPPPVTEDRPAVRPPPSTSLSGVPAAVASTRTVVPEDVEERILTLRERGALLQKLHFSKFMAGYDVYIGPAGEVGTAIGSPAATIQVRGDRVSFVAHADDLAINGIPCPPDVPIGLSGASRIELGGQSLEYNDLGSVEADGWPYLGEIRRPGGAVHLVFGERYGIGRDRANKVRLPDEPHNDNIVWLPEADEGGMIRSLTGDVPKSRFYTDSIMVASRHAEIDLGQEPVIVSLARHCYTYVRRGRDYFPLAPTQERGGLLNMDLQAGDEVYIGNCIFGVGYPPADGPRVIPSDAGGLTAAELAGEDDGVSFIDEELPEPPPGEDVPAAAGLGERGEPPPQPEISTSPFDSLMGTEAPPAPRVDAPPPPPSVPPPPEVPAPPPRTAISRDPAIDAFFETTTFDPGGPEVAIVDEADWQHELARPARLTLVGFMVSGEGLAGNHSECAIRLPENRSNPDQFFAPVDYFKVFVRGRRAQVDLVADSEVRMTLGGQPVRTAREIDGLLIEVVRRDADGEEDFAIPMQFGLDVVLPDPRARLLEIDAEDMMVRALFTLGLPLRTPRAVTLGPIRFTALFDGSDLTLSEYLDTYRRSDGSFHPFFVRRGGAGYRTVPEDGVPINLQLGDGLIAGTSVYVFDR